MARRILNRKDLRADYDAAEARRKQSEEDERDDDEEEDDEEDDEEAAEAGDEDEEALDEDEEAPVKKKKKVAAKEAKPKRVRTPKVVRMRVVWGVFNNSNQRVASFDYPKKAEAEEHARKLMADKKQTFFIQPIKEPIEDKKDR